MLHLWYFDNSDLSVIIGQMKWGCCGAQQETAVSQFTDADLPQKSPVLHFAAVRRRKSTHLHVRSVTTAALAAAASKSSSRRSLETGAF